MVIITADFETQSRAPLKMTGPYEYSLDPSTIATCLGFKSNKSPKDYLLDYHQMQRPWAQLPSAFRDMWLAWVNNPFVVFSAHNAFFEQCIYNNVLVARLGWPKIPMRRWRCTAVRAAAVAIPRNLDGAGQVMKLTVQKDYEGHRVMMKLCKPTSAHARWKKQYDKYIARDLFEQAEEWSLVEPPEFWTPETAPEDYKILYKYCRIDVRTEEKLDEALPPLTDFEQELWFIDQKINMRGTAVDMPLVKKISGILKAESKSMGKELDVVTMGLVSSGNARAQILDFLEFEGIELPDLKAKTVDDFLKNGNVTGDAKRLLEIRRALSKASTAKYQKFLMCAASDGRVRDLFMMNAASTGRWGGKNVQPQNFPRGVIKDIDEAIHRIETCDVDDLKMLYGQNLMPLFSSVLRGMFIASKGYELFVEDYSAIECRVLWWVAGNETGLQYFRDGIDPYKVRAADIFDKSILEITDDERQVGKAAELGCGYQMGPKKFKVSAWDVYRAQVDEDLAKIAVTSYRKDNWQVVELWDDCEQACIDAIENPGKVFKLGKLKFSVKNSFLWIELPSGRRLAYKDPSAVMSPVIIMKNAEGERIYAQNLEMIEDAETLGYVRSGSFQAKKIRYWAVNQKARKEDCVIPKWTREATYGGKLVENIVQAISRDILAEAIVRAEKAGFRVLMHSHDECVSEAPIGTRTSEEYKAIMETLPEWAEGLPLKTGGWSGPRYKKG